MAVTITSPTDGDPVDVATLQVSGTDTDGNAVAGLLIDENSGNAWTDDGSGQFPLTFSSAKGQVDPGDPLLVDVYDTGTGDSAQATYYQQQASRFRGHSVISINVPPVSSTGVRDIQVTVEHRQHTKGFVVLILQKRGVARPKIQVQRLAPGTQTPWTFAQITMDDWVHVWVNVLVEREQGYQPQQVK